MRSFISSSKPAGLFYAKALAGACALLILVFEISSAYLLKHHSETYTRVSRQYAEALKVRPSKPAEPASVLMVGNSLLLEGVDVQRLHELTAGQVRVYPVFLEGTGYYDWLYGLRKMFREGVRPQVVVLGVGVNSFLANSVRQDYVPMIFFDTQDAYEVASDLKLDHTATSNLLLAHSSAFWDTRSVIRTQILRHTIPRYRELVSLLKPQPAIPPASVFQETADSRLQRLRELCEAHGAKLILLVPPTLSSEVAIREMTAAAQKVGVQTLVPIDPTALSAKYYQSDELHLNPEGAALFTLELAASLPNTVALVRESTVSPD
jgi:lysophospholipase L1-like esterase